MHQRYAKPQMDYDRTQIVRMHADTKSVRLIFICDISFPWDAPHVYHLFYIHILALSIPSPLRSLKTTSALTAPKNFRLLLLFSLFQ
jgi:hypothetical protein